MRNDIGYVLIDGAPGAYRIRVCADRQTGADEPKVIAVHTGVKSFVLDDPDAFDTSGQVQRSREPLQVYVASDDKQLHVTRLVAGLTS